jgi:2-keto-3-deoxy-L-rhamnonate aldolase RhmA
MIKRNPVKALLKAGKPVVGTWLTLCAHPRMAKIFAACGFDFIIIDMEHTDFDMQTVGNLILVAREAGLVPIVRPPGTLKPHDLTRPLDAGAMGLLLPMIETAEQIRWIINMTKYYPEGGRVMNLQGPHTDYAVGNAIELMAHVNENTLTLLLIENSKGLNNLNDICRVDGIDGIIPGVHDLSQDLGVPEQDTPPAIVINAIEQVGKICKANNVPWGMSCENTESAEKWISNGAQWLTYSNDAAMILKQARDIVPKLMKIGGRA